MFFIKNTILSMILVEVYLIAGILDKPVLPANITADEVKYKILLVGKSGVGKTSTIAKLSGNDIPNSHSETPGKCSFKL